MYIQDLTPLLSGDTGNSIIIYKGDSPKYYSESLLWAHIRDKLNDSGLVDVVKKRPDKDGHMTSAPFYLRERKYKWCLYDPLFAIRGLHEEFNHKEQCALVLWKPEE